MVDETESALSFINRSVKARDPQASPHMSWEELLAYFDAKTPGWRRLYRKDFGREPTPAGVAELIARETGNPTQGMTIHPPEHFQRK